MPEFRCSAIINGVEHVNYIEISDQELTPRVHLGEKWNQVYRNNIITGRVNNWALSLFNLSWEEVKQDEGDADSTNPSITQPKTTKGAG